MPKFTIIKLNPLGRKTILATQNPERLHAIIERSLGPTDGRNPDGVRPLWRLDKTDLIIVSEGTPDERTIREQLDIIAYRSGEYTLPDKIKKGEKLLFRLRANAVKRDARTRKHVAFTDETALIDWMQRKGQSTGFHLTQDHTGAQNVRIRQEHQIFQKKPGDARRVTLVSTIYDGMLIVDDPDILKAGLLSGIGPAKAYGHGLLSVAPLSTD